MEDREGTMSKKIFAGSTEAHIDKLLETMAKQATKNLDRRAVRILDRYQEDIDRFLIGRRRKPR